MAQAARQGRQQAILDAADRLFGAQGFSGVSARDVAREAGVNKALVFYYFGSMEALFDAVLERYYADHREVFAAAFAADAPIEDRLHQGIDAYLDFIEANQRYPRLVQSVIAGHAEAHPRIEENIHALYEFVHGALGEVAPETGPLAARHFFVTLSGAVVNYFTYAAVLRPVWEGDPLSEAGLAERRAHLHWLVDTLIAGLRRHPVI